MSEKLKIMQTRILSQEVQEVNPYCASIGHPDLTLPRAIHAYCHDSDQPKTDEAAFDRLVQAAYESKFIAME